MNPSRWVTTLLTLGIALVCPGPGFTAAVPEAASRPPEAQSIPSRVLDWKAAIETGLEHNPLIPMAQRGVDIADALLKQDQSVNYPWISAYWANSGGNTRVLANLGISGSLPKPTNYLTTPGLRADFLITDFGHTAHKLLSSKALRSAMEQDVLAIKALVILRVQQAYLACLKQARLVEIAREVLNERELIRTQAEEYYRHKLRSKLDLDFSTVEARKAELALVRAQNDRLAAFAVLSTAMGVQTTVQYELENVSLEIQAAEPLEVLFDRALVQRPELQGSAARQKAGRQAVEAAKALHFGHVDAIGTMASTWWSRPEYNPGGTQKNPGLQQGWWGAAAAGSFPIFTGFRIQGQVDEARGRSDEVQAETRLLANDVVFQVAQAYLSRLTSEQQIRVAEERVAHAREALTLARERYKAGLGSILDVTTATAGLLGAQVGLADAQYDYRGSDAALAYASGSEYRRH